MTEVSSSVILWMVPLRRNEVLADELGKLDRESLLKMAPMLLSEFDDPERYVGALLVGSAARGDARLYSDIDLVFYAFEEPSDDQHKYRLVYRDERLVSLSIKTLDTARAAFTNPVEAIGSIQGLRDSVVLRDSVIEDLSKLKAAAMKFKWTAELKAAANREVSYQLMGNVEEVHKVLGGLSKGDDMVLLNGAWGLAIAMPMVMALKHNILSAGDNLFRTQVCQAVGIESRWTSFTRYLLARAQVHLAIPSWLNKLSVDFGFTRKLRDCQLICFCPAMLLL
jgi:predicted nucleotidyltransferase